MISTSPEEYLKNILTPLCEIPASIGITKAHDERGILLSLTLDKRDMPRVIGREGATSLAIRNLLRVYGARNAMHLSLKINEPGA